MDFDTHFYLKCSVYRSKSVEMLADSTIQRLTNRSLTGCLGGPKDRMDDRLADWLTDSLTD